MRGLNNTGNSGGRSSNAFQLNLSTQGYCFLCLKKPPTKANCSTSSPSSASKFFQNLCRNLKVNVGKLVKENIKTPGIAEKMGIDSTTQGNTNMTSVSLCGRCDGLTKQFSSLFENLEKIQMEMDFCLEEIHQNILEGERDPELNGAFQEMMSRDLTSLIMTGFIDELKKEIMNKCSQTRFSAKTFKVDLNFVPQKVILAPSHSPAPKTTEVIQRSTPRPSTNIVSASSLGLHLTPTTSSGRKTRSSLKARVQPNLDAAEDADQRMVEDEEEDHYSEADNGSAYHEDEAQKSKHKSDSLFPFDKTTGKFRCRHKSCPKQFNNRFALYNHCKIAHKSLVRKRTKSRRSNHRRLPNKERISLKGKFIMDKATGKFKCADAKCPLQFSTPQGAHMHNQAAHLKLRFKCDKCQRDDFRYLAYLERHKKKCDGSGTVGRRKRNHTMSRFVLDKVTGRYKCLEMTCERQFVGKQVAYLHYQRHHLNIRYKCEKCKEDFVDFYYMKRHRVTCEGPAEGEPEEINLLLSPGDIKLSPPSSPTH